MAGRKQHYIPQHLLRGFEASRSGKKSQVVVYKRGVPPYTSSTEGVAAQRDFYSPPGDGETNTLDDVITKFEEKFFNPFLDRARAAPDGELIDADTAATAVVHLAFRASHLRGSFAQFVQKHISNFGNLLGDQNQLREFMEIDSHGPDSLLATEIKRTLDDLGLTSISPKDRLLLEKLARFRVREKFDLGVQSTIPSIRDFLTVIHGALPEMLERSHQQALQKSLAPEKRLEALKRLVWRVTSVKSSEHLLLPDCVAIASDFSGEMHPYAMRSNDEVTLVAMPINAKKILVGSVSQELPDISWLNTHFAKCSLEFFVGSVKDPRSEALTPYIGEVIKDITDSYIEDNLQPTRSAQIPRHSSGKSSSKTIRVEFASTTYRNARTIKAIQRIAAEQYDNSEVDRIDSILVASDVPGEVAHMYGRPLSAYEILAVTPGTVEILATPASPQLRVIIPARIAQLLLVRDTNLSRSAANLVRLLLGRARYYGLWLTKVVPHFQGRMFTAKERLTLELAQRFLSHNYGLWVAAPAIHMADIRDGEPISAKTISVSVATIEAARRQFLGHHNADTLLADVVPALDMLFVTVAAYCGLHASKSLDISPTSETGQCIADARLWEWLMLFDRDLRNHHNQILQTSPTLQAVQSIAEHVERMLWQFGIFLSDTDKGQLWVDVSDEERLVFMRHILNS